MSVTFNSAIRAARLLACALAVASTVAGPADAAQPTRPLAAPFLGMPAVSSLGSPSDWKVVEVFPNLTFNDPVFMIPEPGSNRLWVTEREGRIVSFENEPDVATSRVVFDLRDVTVGDGDSGLLSMAFHPQYAQTGSPSEGLIFAAYTRRDSDDDDDEPLHFRVSRFRVDRRTGVADTNSERVLIDQIDEHVWHQGGALLFRPSDGFLYVSVGDEGGGRCGYGNCQRIDRDLFAGVLRIDVDRIGGAVSHPPPRDPQTGSTANYNIPAGNPFVGRSNSLEEFYALGLRSPHRMTVDPVDDLIWIADVGQSVREEIEVLTPGANFQWNIREGSVPFQSDGEPPAEVVGNWTPPLFDYGRDVGGTVIGGYVYRGAALPELHGRYVYGDFLSGRIWALTYGKAGDEVRILDNEELLRTPFRARTNGITSFGLDADGELYVLTLGEAAKLYKLVDAPREVGNLPLTLSATGLFENLADLVAVPALVPFDVLVPLWSDGAAKRRWMSVPSSGVIDYSADRPWSFPPGSVFVKHFEFQLDADDPDSLRRLETRVLVVQEDHRVYGVTYKWREDGSDADLLTTSLVEDLEVRDADGTEHIQQYLYPGPIDCLTCHDEGARFVLGPQARQFDGVPAGMVDDQLEWLADAGFLDVNDAGLNRAAIPPFAGLDDEGATEELRARSYLDVNCAHCHGWQVQERATWDARITTPLNRQGIVLGRLLGDYGGENDRVVRPGELDTSVLFERVVSTEPGLRMPPLGRRVRDDAAVAVLEDWILAMSSSTLPPPLCGDSTTPYERVTAADALAVLRGAIGIGVCTDCICDVDAGGSVAASDALRVLRASIGIPQVLDCPDCE